MNAIDTITWPSMSVDEYAALETALGANLVRTAGVWWRQVRPFFYRPLLPFCELSPDGLSCPFWSLVGGVQHIVPQGAHSNSRLGLLIFEEPHTYSLENLSQNSRRHIRRAMQTFSVRPIEDLDEFTVTGHAVYLSFVERTKYGYKTERTDIDHFAAWARTLFRFPKVQILGAYRGDDLQSVSVSYVVEHVAFTATFFSRSDALGDYVAELMLHAVRERAAASDNVKVIFAASAGMERGLDEFYLRRGAKLISKPARLRMNPLVLLMLKGFKRDEYLKLGVTT